jgi:CheY-like chemotaxis protein
MIDLVAPGIRPQAPPQSQQLPPEPAQTPTTIRLSSPVPATARIAALTPPVIPAPIPVPIKVLLVEDDPEAAELVRIYLAHGQGLGETESFEIERTSNLLDAMQRLSTKGIDVVLLDLGLPELSGYKSHLAIARAADSGTPVVIFTADESAASRAFTIDLGAAAYLVKDKTPPAQLRSALRNAVRKPVRDGLI